MKLPVLLVVSLIAVLGYGVAMHSTTLLLYPAAWGGVALFFLAVNFVWPPRKSAAPADDSTSTVETATTPHSKEGADATNTAALST
jgi:hypothetical protein